MQLQKRTLVQFLWRCIENKVELFEETQVLVVVEEVAQAGGFFEAEFFCGLVHRAFCFADVLLDGGRCEVGCRRLRYGDFAEGFGKALDGGAAS